MKSTSVLPHNILDCFRKNKAKKKKIKKIVCSSTKCQKCGIIAIDKKALVRHMLSKHN